MMLGGTIKLNPLGMILISGTVIVVLLFYLRSNSTPASTIKLKTLLIESIIAAEKGGLQVKNIHDIAELNIKSKGKTKEGANNPLTDADLKSHYAMVKSLDVALGNVIKVISEEHAYSDAFHQLENSDHHIELTEINKIQSDETVDLRDVVVWIDPLDATQEFTEDLLQYVTVMVCVAVKGKPVIGVVHKPFEKETTWGWAGYGVSENLHSFTELGKPEKLKRIIVSRSHSGTVEQVSKSAFGDDIEIIPAGGAGYKVIQVITGHADAYVHVTQIKKWDLCAGHALLNAVGGKMTTLDGSSIDYSHNSEVVNEGGLLATVHNHELYLKSLVKLQNKV